MEYKFYPSIYFGIGILNSDKELLKDRDIFSALGIVYIDIRQKAPNHTVARYGMEMINHKYLLELDEHFYRHVLMYWKCSKDGVVGYLENLANRCATYGLIWNTLLWYAEHEDSNWFFPGDRVLGPVIVGHEPQGSWHIEGGRDLEGVSESFDERIVADITWLGEDGVQCYFSGYWYAVSRAYIEAAFQSNDPYYRRHVYIPKVFKKEILDRCFNRTLNDFSQIPLEYRENYLMGHFEYDNIRMLYER